MSNPLWFVRQDVKLEIGVHEYNVWMVYPDIRMEVSAERCCGLFTIHEIWMGTPLWVPHFLPSISTNSFLFKRTKIRSTMCGKRQDDKVLYKSFELFV